MSSIKISELDLTDPADRRLWDRLYGKTVKGDLECLDCRQRDPGCPQWMFLQLRHGRPIAVHYTTGIRHPTAPESPRHKALKERIARAAENAGYSAELEACAPDGQRRTDVLVHGDNGLQLGCEIQLSYATAHSVTKRSDIARADGLSPLWTTDDVSAPLIERTPWARIDRLPREILSSKTALLIRGGVKELTLTRCDSRSPLPCPDRGYGRCNQWHGTWSPTHGVQLDQLIGATAAGEYVPLYLPAQPGRRARAAHMWVTAQDRETYHDATDETPHAPLPGTVDDNDPALPERLPLNRTCTYTESAEEGKNRSGTPRDTGTGVAAGITLTDPTATPAPPPEPRPTTFLSYIATQHRALPRTTVPSQQRRSAPMPVQPGTPPTRAFAPATAPRPGSARPSAPAPTKNPDSSAAMPTSAPRPDRRALAARLRCTPDQVGPCASCQEPTRRYGDGGNPLCAPCRNRPRR